MRHKLSIPDQPNVLFLIIVFDLIALLGVYGLYASNWVGQGAQPVQLPQGGFGTTQLSEKGIIVKIFPEPSKQCVIGNKILPLEDLEEELLTLQDKFGVDEVLLMMDVACSVSRERDVFMRIQSLELNLLLVTEKTQDD